MNDQAQYHYFLIMVSHTETTTGGQSTWRYRLEDPRTSQQWGAINLEELFQTLNEVLAELVQNKEL
ncbi:MAG: hypothetical protein KDE59_25200 [Anaerolineales bacterium]|nr:hypothetical protein [Anaerolineales bacterium]